MTARQTSCPLRTFQPARQHGVPGLRLGILLALAICLATASPALANTPREADWALSVLWFTPFLILMILHPIFESCMALAIIGILMMISGPGGVFLKLAAIYIGFGIIRWIAKILTLASSPHPELTGHRIALVIILPGIIAALIASPEFSGIHWASADINQCRAQMAQMVEDIETIRRNTGHLPATMADLGRPVRICPLAKAANYQNNPKKLMDALGSYGYVRGLDGSSYALFCLGSAANYGDGPHHVYRDTLDLPVTLPFAPQPQDEEDLISLLNEVTGGGAYKGLPNLEEREAIKMGGDYLFLGMDVKMKAMEMPPMQYNLVPLYISGRGLLIPRRPVNPIPLAFCGLLLIAAWNRSWALGPRISD